MRQVDRSVNLVSTYGRVKRTFTSVTTSLITMEYRYKLVAAEQRF